MDELYLIANGLNKKFPNGNEPFQIATRILEECGETAKEVNHWENSGVKLKKYGEPKKEELAHEIRQSLVALAQLAVYYGIEKELDEDIAHTLAKMRGEGLITL
jgi:hypothetical protein